MSSRLWVLGLGLEDLHFDLGVFKVWISEWPYSWALLSQAILLLPGTDVKYRKTYDCFTEPTIFNGKYTY